MKKIVLALALLVTGLGSLTAQEFNRIPYNPEIKGLVDGWYKFSIEGTSFDVEVSLGRYVKGNISWFDGTTYSGDLSGTNLSGRGTYTWPDGSKYEGTFKKHQMHGKGSYTTVDGQKWSGKWKNNQKNGKGTMFDSEGSITKKGVWQSGELVAEK